MKRIVNYMGTRSRPEMDDMLAKEGIGPKGRTLQIRSRKSLSAEKDGKQHRLLNLVVSLIDLGVAGRRLNAKLLLN